MTVRFVDRVDRWADNRLSDDRSANESFDANKSFDANDANDGDDRLAQPAGGDILSNERRLGRRWWWPGNWLRSRWLGIAVLVSFLALGYFWLSFLDGGSVFRRDDGRLAPASSEEAGRPLLADEVAVASRYGDPIHLGESGLPVVRHDMTGRVRELTPVEMEFDGLEPFVSSGDGTHFFGPGPRGWGLWWADDTLARAYGHRVYFSRNGWRDRQEQELRFLADQVSLGLEVAVSVDLESWQPGWADALELVIAPARERYPLLDVHGDWAALPAGWACDPQLEVDLTYGLTVGCPDERFDSLVADCWKELGMLVDLMTVMANVGRDIDRLSYSSRGSRPCSVPWWTCWPRCWTARNGLTLPWTG